MIENLDALYADIRAFQREDQSRRAEEAYSRSPRFAQIALARQDAMRAVGEGRISSQEGKERLAQLRDETLQELSRLGLPEDYLLLREKCGLCHDTGFVEAHGLRRPCACRLKLMFSMDSSVNERETFESFDPGIFTDEQQKKRTLNAKKIAERYADALPRPDKPTLLIMGMVGLGKSYLGNAVAYRAVCRGVDTLRVTAYRFTQDALEDIRNHANRMQRYQDVPLLVLDDLGSEPIIPNVSREWLFTIVNERTMARRATVILTNLSFEALLETYGERVSSRLIDQNLTSILHLTGKDLRLG